MRRCGTTPGIYYEVGHETGPFLHAVFRVDCTPGQAVPAPRFPEVDAAAFWPTGALPRPLSDFTSGRIIDASAGHAVTRVIHRRAWLPDPG